MLEINLHAELSFHYAITRKPYQLQRGSLAHNVVSPNLELYPIENVRKFSHVALDGQQHAEVQTDRLAVHVSRYLYTQEDIEVMYARAPDEAGPSGWKRLLASLKCSKAFGFRLLFYLFLVCDELKP
ncbi:hypothetical protein DPMN_025552 [Dreissena polymorpha]|uniref:Uncharacterized protein n=1 Tax=Dreissena polymorpha TaxID=45954 RepID=A0A9D4LQ13_DREPO|nr:hypothetical protein DPMN_025552 [Dreissena polymorpha]